MIRPTFYTSWISTFIFAFYQEQTVPGEVLGLRVRVRACLHQMHFWAGSTHDLIIIVDRLQKKTSCSTLGFLLCERQEVD